MPNDPSNQAQSNQEPGAGATGALDPAARGRLIPVEDATARILSLARPVGVETIGLDRAAGRVLRAELLARRTQPPFDAAAMDGYAVRADDAVRGGVLTVIGETAAGRWPERAVSSGEAMRIFTGAPMPAGANAILLQEDAEPVDGAVIVRDTTETGRWVRPSGGDFHEGSAVLTAPRRLSAADVALAAAAGVPWATVARRPRVAIIALGDELRLPGEALEPAQIVSSNNFGVAAIARARGADATLLPIAADQLDHVRETIRDAASADLIVAIGGASEGDHDLARAAFAAEGFTPELYKIAMRPGKPLMAGRLGEAVVVGLPGNPVSALVCAHIFIAPLIDALSGLPSAAPASRLFPAHDDQPANGPRAHYQRAELIESSNGVTVRPFPNQDSSLLSILARADVLAIRPAGDPPKRAGDLIACIPLRPDE